MRILHFYRKLTLQSKHERLLISIYLGIVCIAILAMILFIIHFYTNAFFSDQWDIVVRYYKFMNDEITLLHSLFDKTINHYSFLAYGIGFLDLYFFAGRSISFFVWIFLFNLLTLGTLLASFYFVRATLIEKSIPLQWFFPAILYIIALFTPISEEIFLNGFQVTLVGARFFIITTFFLLILAIDRNLLSLYLGATIFAFLAAFSYGAGFFVFPVMAIIAFCQRNKHASLIVLSSFFFFLLIEVIGLFSHHPFNLLIFRDAIRNNLISIIDFFLIYLGSPFAIDIHIARLIGIGGFIGIVMLVFSTIKKYRRNNLFLFHLGIVIFTLISGIGAALLHAYWSFFSQSQLIVDQALASRYTAYSLMFWVSFFSLYHFFGKNNVFRIITTMLIIISLLFSSIHVHRVFLQRQIMTTDAIRDATIALTTKVYDKEMINFLTTPSSLDISLLLSFLSQQQLSTFADPFRYIGKHIDPKLLISFPHASIMFLEPITYSNSMPSGFTLGSRAYFTIRENLTSHPVSIIVDRDGKILGLARVSRRGQPITKETFDQEFYFKMYPDVFAKMKTIPDGGWLHYIDVGKKEGRAARLKIFDPANINFFGYVTIRSKDATTLTAIVLPDFEEVERLLRH